MTVRSADHHHRWLLWYSLGVADRFMRFPTIFQTFIVESLESRPANFEYF